MKKKQTCRLRVAKSTITYLGTPQLGKIQGGAPPRTRTAACDGFTCNTCASGGNVCCA